MNFLKNYWAPLVIILIVLVAVGGYLIGFRIGGNGITRNGTLTVTNLPKGASVYADQVLKQTMTMTGTSTLGLVPGKHAIIVGMPDFYPWSTVVTIASGKTTIVDPLLIPMQLHLTPLSGTAYSSAYAAIASSTLPTEAAPLRMQNGCTLVYAADNQIIEEAATSTPGCTQPVYLCVGGSCAPTIAFSSPKPIVDIFPFPGRQDALVMSLSNTLYALSLNPTNPQFFAPLVQGPGTKYGRLPDGSIVVESGSVISKISL